MTIGPPRALEGASLPPRLSELPDPPRRLFLHGEVPRTPSVAVVGTRTPTPEAKCYARELSAELARRGVAVFSGGAKGIDAAAHLGALEAGGVTLVVAPSSFDQPYPKQHAALYERIVQSGGGYVSPFEHGVQPERGHFFVRNSCLVALCHVLVIVEASLRSGARNAASWSRRLGRPLFVAPSPPWNPQGLGCIAELQLGARPLAGVGDILRALDEQQLHPIAPEPENGAGVAPQGAPTSALRPEPRATAAPPLNPVRRTRRSRRGVASGSSALEAAILELLAAGPRYPDALAAATGARAPELSHALLTLTLAGEITESASGELTRARR